VLLRLIGEDGEYEQHLRAIPFFAFGIPNAHQFLYNKKVYLFDLAHRKNFLTCDFLFLLEECIRKLGSKKITVLIYCFGADFLLHDATANG
ncbi:MAG: hypothetical protein QM734_16155, partial [Cyclobacteriaceae bacterium]